MFFHGKLKFCLEKVTELPDLTVFHLYRDRYRYKSEAQGSLKFKYRVDLEIQFPMIVHLLLEIVLYRIDHVQHLLIIYQL